jgi:two-component system, OmpR family, response regulator
METAMPETQRMSPIEAVASPPLVLLAEDDAISRRFLVDALGQLGCDVEACADGARALVLAAAHRFDLMILDRRMPRAGAEEILRRLRGDSHARSRATSAVATSAEITCALREDLLAQGFAAVLSKPVDVDTLRSTLDTLLPQREIDAVLHDAAALARSGNAETMHALRALFVTELQRLLAELPDLAGDTEGFADRLHQLRAACGFCGAEALAQHAIRLRMRIDRGDAIDAEAERRFEVTVRATLDALAARD